MGQQSPHTAKFRQLALAMLYQSMCLIISAGLVSCQADPVKPFQQTAGAASVSVCEIVTHKNSYIGRTVEITALWKTDNLHYSYFEDPKAKSNCHAQNLIQLGYMDKMHDESVIRFFDAGKKLCEAKNQLSTCVQTARVEFIAKIMSDKDGLYIHLDKVLNYKYLE